MSDDTWNKKPFEKEINKKKSMSKKKKVLIGAGIFVFIFFFIIPLSIGLTGQKLSNPQTQISDNPFDYLSQEDRDHFDLMTELCENAKYQAAHLGESTMDLVFGKCYEPHYKKYLQIGTENMEKALTSEGLK
jgi:uncharacterized membrane protein YvbJ